MEIILQEDYPQLGYVGDRVVVKNGFARNYLIPQGIGFEVTSRNAKELEHRLQGILAKKKRKFSEAEAFGEEVKKIPLKFKLKVGEKGKSFGSITARDIQLAYEQAGQNLDRKQIRLGEAIKSPGSYTIEVKLHSEVSIEVPVEVEGEKIAKKKSTEEKKAKKSEAEDATEEDQIEDGQTNDEAFDVSGEEETSTEESSDE